MIKIDKKATIALLKKKYRAKQKKKLLASRSDIILSHPTENDIADELNMIAAHSADSTRNLSEI